MVLTEKEFEILDFFTPEFFAYAALALLTFALIKIFAQSEKFDSTHHQKADQITFLTVYKTFLYKFFLG